MTSTYSSNSNGSKRRKGSRPYRPRLLRDSGITPAKALGQHFLNDTNIVRRIVDAAELTAAETVIEVGPGLGVLTQLLTEAAKTVIAVEMDRRLAQRLRETPTSPNLTVVESDVLALTPGAILEAGGLAPDSEYVVVANLPYNAGAAIIRHFLESANPPQRLVVMLQREVAASITAAPGELGLLGIGVQVYAEPKRLFNVAPGAFVPPPKVVSTVIRLDVRPQLLVPAAERDAFFTVVRAGFSAPRKQIRNSLAQGLLREPSEVIGAIETAGIDPTARPETLSVDAWLRLSRAVAAT